MQLGQERDKVLETSPEPIDGPCCDEIELSADGGFQQSVEGLPVHAPLSTRDAFVGEYLHDLVSGVLRPPSEFPDLVLYGLPVGADPRIDRVGGDPVGALAKDLFAIHHHGKQVVCVQLDGAHAPVKGNLGFALADLQLGFDAIEVLLAQAVAPPPLRIVDRQS